MKGFAIGTIGIFMEINRCQLVEDVVKQMYKCFVTQDILILNFIVLFMGNGSMSKGFKQRRDKICFIFKGSCT